MEEFGEIAIAKSQKSTMCYDQKQHCTLDMLKPRGVLWNSEQHRFFNGKEVRLISKVLSVHICEKGEIILICKQFFLMIQPRVPTTLKFLKSLPSVEYLEVERLQREEYRFKMGLQKLIIFWYLWGRFFFLISNFFTLSGSERTCVMS